MEYKVVKNNSTEFWEDNKDNSFGIGKDLVIKLDKNKILVESRGVDVFLIRDNKKAKISDNEKAIKGIILERIFAFVGTALYLIFAIVIVKQVSMMTKNVNDKFNGVVIVFSYIHLALAVFLMLMSIIWP